MKCEREDLKALITDVLVGEVEPSVKDKVLSHVEDCSACREVRDEMEKVLGLLKEAPPWTAAATNGAGDTAADGAADGASDQRDTLSMIQRQKIESLAARRSAAPAASKATGFSRSWLGMAASLSAVGLALFLARQGGERPIEPGPAPVATDSFRELPQAPEELDPLPSSASAAEPPSSARPAEIDRGPVAGLLVPENTSEARRLARPDAEPGQPLAQAAEANEVQPLKNDVDRQLRDERGVAGGVAGGIVGDRASILVPRATEEIKEQESARPAATPAPPVATNRPQTPMVPQELRPRDPGLLAPVEVPPGLEARSAARGNESGSKSEESLRTEGGLSGAERDRGGASGFAPEPRRLDLPAPPPPPRDMLFEAKGTNAFILTEEDPQATFGLDVDTASYTLTRNYLNRGLLPPAEAVRVEEFVNAFPNNVAAGRADDRGSAFAVRVDGAPNPLYPGYHILRVAMKAKDVDPRERKAARLTFVIDVSGSMARENRLGLVKRSLALLVDRLDERDTIGIVVYGTGGRRLLAPTSVANRDRILSAINDLRPEGSTNLQQGLDLGYDMAMESFDRRASNRVVLCTDGVANTGRTEADVLLARVRSERNRGIDMMALGFGMGNYNDALLQRLADEGNGQYAYIDDLAEARTFFLRRLTSVLEVVARDARAQVEFNPARVERYRLLGYEKRDVADRDFRNDSVDAGEINSGHSVTALFEVELTGSPRSGRIGTARIRYQAGPGSEGREYSREIVDEAVARSFGQASPAFRTAFVASRFAEHLRGSYWVKDESLAAVRQLADELPESEATNELADLISRAVRLQGAEVREY